MKCPNCEEEMDSAELERFDGSIISVIFTCHNAACGYTETR